jgi:hypothetical protein
MLQQRLSYFFKEKKNKRKEKEERNIVALAPFRPSKLKN